jgi:hypothetical protein
MASLVEEIVMQNFTDDVPALAEPLSALSVDDLVVSVDNSELENRQVSDCGRFESFDYNGYHFEIDWDEIDPPGVSDDEPQIPHEQVMEKTRALIKRMKGKR